MKIKKQQYVGIRCLTSAPLLAGLLFTLSLIGCANNSATRIDARDNSVAIGEMRMAYNFDNIKEAATPHTGHAVVLGVTKTSGKANQSLAAGQSPIIHGDKTFTAPQQLQNEFELTQRELSWRYRKFRSNEGKPGVWGLELSAGLGNTLLDLKVSTATQVATKNIERYGALAGVGLLYNLSPVSSFQAKFSVYYAPLAYGINDIERLDLVYARSFHDNLRLRAGYSFWHLTGNNSSESGFKLEFSGPVLALDLEF